MQGFLRRLLHDLQRLQRQRREGKKAQKVSPGDSPIFRKVAKSLATIGFILEGIYFKTDRKVAK